MLLCIEKKFYQYTSRYVYKDAKLIIHDTVMSHFGVDTLKDRREVLTERFFKRHVLPSSSLLHIYSQISVTMTLLIVSDIHNHSTNCGLVLPDFATALYHLVLFFRVILNLLIMWTLR